MPTKKDVTVFGLLNEDNGLLQEVLTVVEGVEGAVWQTERTMWQQSKDQAHGKLPLLRHCIECSMPLRH